MMYLFRANYWNMDDDFEIVRTIEFDGQFLASGKECFLYAMGMAYDLIEDAEILVSLEFMSC